MGPPSLQSPLIGSLLSSHRQEHCLHFTEKEEAGESDLMGACNVIQYAILEV